MLQTMNNLNNLNQGGKWLASRWTWGGWEETGRSFSYHSSFGDWAAAFLIHKGGTKNILTFVNNGLSPWSTCTLLSTWTKNNGVLFPIIKLLLHWRVNIEALHWTLRNFANKYVCFSFFDTFHRVLATKCLVLVFHILLNKYLFTFLFTYINLNQWNCQ